MTQAANKGPHDLWQKEAPGATFAHSVTCRRSTTRPAEFAMKPSTCCALCKLAGAYAPLVARIKEIVKKKRCIFLGFFFLFSPKLINFDAPSPASQPLFSFCRKGQKTKKRKKKNKKKHFQGKRKTFCLLRILCSL